MTDIQYAAFLRGINSSGNPPVKMQVLREFFESLGFRKVRTIIASGNVLFETDSTDKKSLEQKIEKILPETIGFESDVFILAVEVLHKLASLNPFKNIKSASQTRFYVTFTKGKPKTDLHLPMEGTGYTILGIFHDVVCSVVDLSSTRTPHIMQILEKIFSKGITTRNWNTIIRMLKLSSNSTH